MLQSFFGDDEHTAVDGLNKAIWEKQREEPAGRSMYRLNEIVIDVLRLATPLVVAAVGFTALVRGPG